MNLLMEDFLYSNRMGNAEIRVTQGVSSISGHNTVPLSDDLLNTRRMSIEDLIEANEVCNHHHFKVFLFRLLAY